MKKMAISAPTEPLAQTWGRLTARERRMEIAAARAQSGWE
jgi:hypothetical protein